MTKNKLIIKLKKIVPEQFNYHPKAKNWVFISDDLFFIIQPQFSTHNDLNTLLFCVNLSIGSFSIFSHIWPDKAGNTLDEIDGLLRWRLGNNPKTSRLNAKDKWWLFQDGENESSMLTEINTLLEQSILALLYTDIKTMEDLKTVFLNFSKGSHLTPQERIYLAAMEMKNGNVEESNMIIGDLYKGPWGNRARLVNTIT